MRVENTGGSNPQPLGCLSTHANMWATSAWDMPLHMKWMLWVN